MPASEKTWRDQKTLHVVFGCTGLLLLVATVWMFAADHNRQWKRYQRKMRDVDVRMAQWRVRSTETDEVAQRRAAFQEQLEAELSSAPDAEAYQAFVTTLQNPEQQAELQRIYDQLRDESVSAERRADLRAKLENRMQSIQRRAKFEEDRLLSDRKFKSADYDEKRAIYDLAIRDGKPQAELDRLQAEVDAEREARAELTRAYQNAATYRKSLEQSFRGISGNADAIRKELTELQADYARLSTALNERSATYFTAEPPFLGKRWLELPILDAFNSPLKISNLWTEGLTIPNGSFGAVRRFDRCTTCHQAIDATAPGSAVDPLYRDATVIEVEMPTPEERPAATVNEETGETTEPTILTAFGIDLAGEGLINADDVTIRQVLPETPAALAKAVSGSDQRGLKVGDVIAYVNGDKVLSVPDAERYLMNIKSWGSPVRLTVVRGLPQPYSSHPRLDLFVGSLSPHKLAEFGCSICHEGQGSATEFKWVSHTPNSPEQQEEWVREHGWFNNHHWIYPMTPARFAESSCLKCHHDVVELELATQFEEPPAPKLTSGYHLIREYGCFGCHEINGYAGADKRIGPDMRLEPNYFAAAAQLKADPNYESIGDDPKAWVEELIHHPEHDATRHKLLAYLQVDAKQETPQLTAMAHDLIGALADVETPGELRKVGPSLRHLSDKVGPTWLYDWLRDPTHFRPSTKMPRFFGLWDHLDEGEREVAERYEPIEILGIVNYLLGESQPYDELEPPAELADVTDDHVERGKVLFEMRGCLACHQHQDFPAGEATQGPDLSNIGDKFTVDDTPNGRAWMYSWLKNPSLYHPRTKMPDLYLEPMTDADGNTTDPAADIAAYLLSSSTDWTPESDVRELLRPNEEHLDGLVREHLSARLYLKDVDDALKAGRIPDAIAATLTGPEARLVGELTQEKKLAYIGEKTINKYGCYACHDIPGFEKAKPIGTGLADWGRKDTSRLAFEHIAEYIAHGHGHGGHRAKHDGSSNHADGEHQADGHDAAASNTNKDSAAEKIDERFYLDRLVEHDRTGFIWQKLKEPRSYDYAKARNRDSYNDRLRMPMFPFNDVDREAVITFVLGLIAEPPAPEFVYHPSPERAALIEGHKALTKFNCGGCHIIDPETWTLEIPKGFFEEQPSNPSQVFPFMPHQFTTDEVERSERPDPLRGTVTAQVTGMPEVSSDSGRQKILDFEGDEIDPEEEYDSSSLLHPFDLWSPALIDGHAYQVGITPIEIEANWVTHRRPTFGGDLTKLLLPRAVEYEKESNPQADGKQAYGWLPPPLIGQGHKVQTEWLHGFLLEPFPIRPAVMMRMPRFNMSSKEASDLVNYFAAKDDAEYPYSSNAVTQDKMLKQRNETYAAKIAELPEDETPQGDTRFDHVMNIVTSSNYCVQCHIVGDFVPKTSARAMAPDLSVIYRRLRPDYLRRWLANPSQILPYTPMPVNVQYDADAPHLGGVAQQLYHGTSLEQLDGLVDLLMNYPHYAQSQADVTKLVEAAAGAASDGTAIEPDVETSTSQSDAPEDEVDEDSEPETETEPEAADQ
jgi:cytochrome c551/c552